MRIRITGRQAALRARAAFGLSSFTACAIAAAVGCSSEPDAGGATLEEPGSTGAPSQCAMPAAAQSSERDCVDEEVTSPPNPFVPEPSAPVLGLVDDLPEQAPACAEQFVPASRRLPIIQFVVDTSGSMSWVPGTERTPRDGEQSKWEITQASLADAIDAMPDDAAVGVIYYPNAGGGAACYRAEVAAPIAPLLLEHRQLIERMNAAEEPTGGTPTHAAYDFGVEQLETSALDGSRFLVLMTDGIPTFTRECGGDGLSRVDAAPLIADVAKRLETSDIRTFVIGSPGSEAARDELSRMALEGGTAKPGCEPAGPGYCHFDMTGARDFSAALGAALAEITEATLGCEFDLPAAPDRFALNRERTSVVLESNGSPVVELERAESPACDSGWQYGPEGRTIRLCASTCQELTARVQADPNIGVRVKVACSVTPT